MRSGTNAVPRHRLGVQPQRLRSTPSASSSRSSGVKPKLNRNQFGFVFGGPIVRNRTFFFADYEGFRQISKALTFASIPTLRAAPGQPRQADPQPADRRDLRRRRHPGERDHAVRARRCWPACPTPTPPGIANNFDSLPRREDFNDKFDVKVDHQFSTRMTAFGRVQPPQGRTTSSRRRFPGETGSPSNAFVHVLNQQVAGGFTYTLTPTSLLEVRLGVSRTEGRQGASRRRRPDDARALRHHRACRPIRASPAG